MNKTQENVNELTRIVKNLKKNYKELLENKHNLENQVKSN